MESSGNNSHSPSVHRYNTRYKKQRTFINYKEDNDVSDNDISGDEEEKLDIYSYRQLLAELFPSKYLDDKVKATKRLKDQIVAKKVTANNILSNEKSSNIIIAKSNKYKSDKEVLDINKPNNQSDKKMKDDEYIIM